MTQRGWVQVKDLIPKKDHILIENICDIVLTQKMVDLGVPSKSKKKDIGFAVDVEFAWFLGMYIAEGSITNGYDIRFTLNKKEMHIAQRIANTFKEYFDLQDVRIDFCLDQKRGHEWLTVRVGSKLVADWLIDNFGKGFDSKFIPSWMFSLDKHIVSAFLDGVDDGDGSKRNVHQRIIVLSNENLVRQLFLLARYVGYCPSLGEYHKSELATTQPWGMTFRGQAAGVLSNAYYRVEDKSFANGAEVYVYNVEVEEDHSYIANHMCVHNCYCLPIEDDIGSIFNTISAMARIFKDGGGVGINFSNLREKNAELSGGGSSSGTISFMTIFDNIVEVVKQGGYRRGALMGVLWFYHPEIFNFIKVKLEGKLQNFNLSIMVTDDFMQKVDDKENGFIDIVSPKYGKIKEVRAKDIFDIMGFTSWVNGDPALLFYDRINQDNPFFPEKPIVTTNPCLTGDTLIAVADGRNAVSIKQLADDGGDVPVYCKAGKKGTTSIQLMRNIRKTGIQKPVCRVTLDDGSSFKCTSDHLILMRNGEYKEAGKLRHGESVMPFNSKVSDGGYRQIQGYHGGFIKQYRMIYNYYTHGGKKKGIHVHHKDFDKTNDTFENLLGLTVEEHAKYHDISGDKNPIRKLKAAGKFEEFKLRNKGYDNSGANNPMFGKKQTDESKRKNREWHLGREAWNKGLTKETDGRIAKYAERLKVRFYNHAVVSVVPCGYEDVYDGEVDKYHNFGIITSYKDNNFMFSSGIYVHNCSEVGLPAYGACCLGSINISKLVWKNTFNFDRFHDLCQVATRVLINMNRISHYPLPAIKKEMDAHSPFGVGIMGFADCLIKLGIAYDSQECLDFIDRVGKVYVEATKSVDPETFHFYRRIIAPTGSLSILADCSSGIEPIYDVAFSRSLTVGKIEETRDLYKSQYVRTAYQVSPEWHVKVLAHWQKYADGGVSKTVNLLNNASVDDIKDVYKLAWKMGVKGITVYRDGSREEQVLYSRPSTPPKVYMGKCSDGTCTL